MKNEAIVHYLKDLRSTIIANFETLEPTCRFERTSWNHHSGGGGEISLIRGDVFEKAAVNFSAVWGPQFPMGDSEGPFFATGVSLITHMKNPHAPTVHMNVRYIETSKKSWFGGGYDLTPMGQTYAEDTSHFHYVAKQSLDPFDEKLYPLFSQNAKEYFYIPHRKKERGVGGIFFDHFDRQDVWKSVGDNFLQSIMPIYNRRAFLPYTETDKETQLKCRSHYVEFNLLYDRGTKFGFLSGGNPDAILCSMPPVVKW